MARLDDVDMKILSALYLDSSVSIPLLSRRLGINQSVLYSRVRRLQRRGVIERFTVVVDEEKLGLRAGAIAGLNVDPKQRESVLEAIEKVEGVRKVVEVTGRFDMMVEVRGKTLDEIHRVVYDSVGKLPGVMHAEVFIEVSRRIAPVNFRFVSTP